MVSYSELTGAQVAALLRLARDSGGALRDHGRMLAAMPAHQIIELHGAQFEAGAAREFVEAELAARYAATGAAWPPK